MDGKPRKERRSRSLDKVESWVRHQNEARAATDRRSNQTQTEVTTRRSNQMQTEVNTTVLTAWVLQGSNLREIFTLPVVMQKFTFPNVLELFRIFF